ncbi:UDP-Glycosyltransferase/glycogen phosphorylase [Auriculariales sp. MPI-PUGE-AT-0066]|nr:UDP-Glycosyltransferase/glycogen phosphorylase [Auriculariales sp. MPI-PUGE-AT-0066]
MSWPTTAKRARKLRIALVTENFMPKVDGVTRTLARLLTHLREQGHECIVLGPESGMSYYETHPLIGTAGVPLVLYPGLKLNFLRPRFLRAILEFNPDVIHVVDPVWLGGQFLLALDAGWCGPQWQGPDRKPVVASYHTNLPTYATLFGLSFLEPIMWGMLRRLHASCVLTACPSFSTIDDLREHHGFNNLRLWPRGVDLSVFSPTKRSAAIRDRLMTSSAVASTPPAELSGLTLGNAALRPSMSPTKYSSQQSGNAKWPHHPLTPPPSPPLSPVDKDLIVILYVGRISYEKNLQLLLDAFAYLVSGTASSTPSPRASPELDAGRVRLVMVGDGPHRSALEASAASQGIAHLTTFTGQISQPADLASWYASADVFAFPSFTETFGQVVCEALASGLPVIGLDAAGTRDLVEHSTNGLLLPRDGDAKAYAVLLDQVVRDDHMRRNMGVAAVRSAQGKTWAGAMERMVDCYREAVAQYDERHGVVDHAQRRAYQSTHISELQCPFPGRGLTLLFIITLGLVLCHIYA